MHFWLPNQADGIIDSSITQTPATYAVNNIPQEGATNRATQYVRSGAKCRMTGFYFRGYLKMPNIDDPGTDDQIGAAVRIIMYVKKQGSENLGLSLVDSADLNMYKILYDKVFVLHSNGPGVKLITIKKSWVRGGKGLGLPLEWTPSSATASGTQTKNEIKMMLVSSSTAAGPKLTAQSRVWFTDS